MLPGEWHHVEPAERTKSDLYRDVLPLINSRTVALLDNPVLQQQLALPDYGHCAPVSIHA
jgi:hypothetical protein